MGTAAPPAQQRSRGVQGGSHRPSSTSRLGGTECGSDCGAGSDGTAHGSGGSVTSVGVGTGGVRLGGDDDAGAEGLGVAGRGAAVCGAGSGEMAGVLARARTGRDVTRATGLGAAPMVPAPPGRPVWPAAAGVAIGVASIQPIAMATGKPIVTSPKNSGLGDNRTL
jgi:hypothetical protein